MNDDYEEAMSRPDDDRCDDEMRMPRPDSTTLAAVDEMTTQVPGSGKYDRWGG